MKVGLIGGTGFYDLFGSLDERVIDTEFGQVTLFQGVHEGKDVYFLPRHGTTHGVLAPYVNYKANMKALKLVGVERVLAVSAVGSINPDIPIGGVSLLEQFVDMTKRRDQTYGEFSADMTEPFCLEMNESIVAAANVLDIALHKGVTLVGVDGPIYETRTELQLFGKWGVDVVGMTNTTEAALARELGLCFSVMTLSTDMATGFAETPPNLETHRNVAAQNKEKMKRLVLQAISTIHINPECNCTKPFKNALVASR
ncbi:MTAP family purine nucleoside phosphorylase [Bacillus sp. Marseille-Q3570]|uniref:MTAP family purine nucleoside phosphorylase n=1 Tax=Bacillus sp. Marseille-Q3570 TaxID=2963522 RepID=UPI0021B7ED1C|nr:MTAP family purine nucleoside phosphorylase [Bacillus sp. Marseille-Q3570]